MRLLRTLAIASIAAAGFVSDGRAGFFDLLFHHDVSVITTTDITPEGHKVPPPSAEHPVYYIAINMGYRDLGGLIAGDRKPAPAAMIKVITKVLAKQGFLPATKKHPPTQVIAYAWGTLYSNKLPSFDPSLPDVDINRSQKLRFLGGEKIGLYRSDGHSLENFGFSPLPELTVHSIDQDMILSAARDDLYITALTGYDYQAFLNKTATPLWRTRISCPSLGLAMDETLPTMIAIAGPMIGRETKKPIWIDASEKYKPNITIGDPVLEEFIDEGRTPVLDLQGAEAPKRKKGK